MIHFVGAGPGAVDLITVRGLSLLKKADVIIYAGSLVNPALLEDAKEGCQIYDSARMTLEEVLKVMEEAQRRGLDTVRLHTGDPSIYGAVREQMDALAEKGIPFDVCPGVSSFAGAAASLRMEYTLPEVSQSLIITPAEGRTPVPERESLSAMAAYGCTLVLFLSAGLAGKVREELLAGGLSPDTPAAVVYKATWPEEQILRTSLGELPERMEEAGISRTALIIVGDVLGDTYARSRLYDGSFTTGYRKGGDRGEGGSDCMQHTGLSSDEEGRSSVEGAGAGAGNGGAGEMRRPAGEL